VTLDITYQDPFKPHILSEAGLDSKGKELLPFERIFNRGVHHYTLYIF